MTVTASYQSIVTVGEAEIIVSSCLGGILGTVKNSSDGSVGSHTFRLYEDFNNDNIADGAFVRSISSNPSTNVWVFTSLTPGKYIVEYFEGVAPNTIISAVDLATFEPTVDPIVFTAPAAGKQYFQVTVRPGLIEGSIALTTLP